MAPVNQNKLDDASVGYNTSNRSRKLVVEKVRRDRINQSIEELRALLHRDETSNRQTSSKMEKADILEMAVHFLRQKATEQDNVPSYSQGFSQCLQETLRHLSLHAPLKPSEREEMKRFYVIQRTSLQRRVAADKGRLKATSKWSTSRSSRSSQGSLWRPW